MENSLLGQGTSNDNMENLPINYSPKHIYVGSKKFHLNVRKDCPSM